MKGSVMEKMDKWFVFDIEADGLLDTITKVHVLSIMDVKTRQVQSTPNLDKIKEFFTSGYTLVGHNIICYDIPAVEKVLGIKVSCRPVDTLPLSWYLFHDRNKHGLEGFGDEFGIPKPKIEDWQEGTYDEYRTRCEQDVRINFELWKRLKSKLDEIYKK